MRFLIIYVSLLISSFSMALETDEQVSWLPSIIYLLDDSGDVSVRWGAEPVGDQYRPERTWTSQFDGVTPLVVADGATSIDDALNQCIGTSACVIQINQLTLSETIYLARSKTKLIGGAGNKITMMDSDNDGGAFIQIESHAQEIVIESLQLDGESTNYAAKGAAGVLVEGQNINKIALVNNEIHHLHSKVLPNGGGDAHGIAVYGNGTTEAVTVTNVLIENNHVHHMQTGSSESIVVNGNVKNWAIRSNVVEHINNIAIDAIGGEGTVPPPVVSGQRTLPHPLDAARYGFIENNTVTDMTTQRNPDYGSEHTYAGAIYIDGGHHIVISGNTVTQSEWAYDIGAENCLISSHISLIGNTANQSYFGDIILGGYRPGGFLSGFNGECNPLLTNDNQEGHGNVDNITVKNNVLNSRPTAPPAGLMGNIQLDNRIHQAIIIQTGMSEEHPDGIVSGDQRSIRTSE